MGDGDKKPSDLRTREPSGPKKGTTTHSGEEAIEALHLYLNNGESGATFTLVPKSGKPENKIAATLVSTILPAGSWRATVVLIKDLFVTFDGLEFRKPEAQKEAAEAQVAEALAENPPPPFFEFAGLNADEAERAHAMFVATNGSQIRIVVAYSKAKRGNSKTLQDNAPPEGGNTADLLDEEIARLYVAFVQHFGDRDVDLSLAEGGLTQDEIDEIEQGRPEIQDITSLFLQCLAEFRTAKPLAAEPEPTLDNFSAMTETIFFQKAARNDLAVRNQLAIAVGLTLVVDGTDLKSVQDIGIARRNAGNTIHLLYDRNGQPVLGSHPDVENREVNMADERIPSINLEMDDSAIYRILRNIEQDIGDPSRQVLSLAVNLYRHTELITDEMLNSGVVMTELQKQVIECSRAVLIFFVAHAILVPVLASGHPVGPFLLIALRAAGIIFGVNDVLATLSLVSEAGREFHRVEFLNRTEEGEEKERTELSNAHLRRGAILLVKAIGEFVAGGVVLIVTGGLSNATRRLGKRLREGVKKGEETVRAEITVEPKKPPKPGEEPKDFIATKIEPKNTKEKVTTTQSAPPKSEPKKSGSGGTKPPAAPDPPPPPAPERKLPTDDGPPNRRDNRVGNQPKKPGRPKGWDKFDERFDEEFLERLKAFRGNDDTGIRGPAGGEGRLFLSDTNPTRALKRWFAKRVKDFERSVQKLVDARAAVEANPALRQHLEVIRVHDKGSDSIVRDYNADSRELKEAINASEAAQEARQKALEALEGTTSEILQDIRKKLSRAKPSANLHWFEDTKKIIVIDME